MSTTTGSTVWREHGDPLVAGEAEGALVGETVAVKDVYAVAGHRVGAGNPEWLAGAAPETAHATAVAALLDVGADVAGIAHTDELAYSLAGVNQHDVERYGGPPPNPAAPGRIPGGSSSGPGAAVALGEASIGLGTDTAGSIRVPAAYQGLFGIRTTHGAVPREGVLPLARSFDAVGWLTRDAHLLARVGEVLLPGTGASGSGRLVVVPDLLRLAEPDVAAAVTGWLPPSRRVEDWPSADLPAWRAAFTTVQAWEAWDAHGSWLADRMGALNPDVRDRFERARAVTDAEAEAARGVVDRARRELLDLVDDRVLALPSVPTVPPALGPDLPARLHDLREATLQLTCLAPIAGLPAVSIPLTTAAGLPCGICLVAAPGRDRDLLALAGALLDP